MTQKNTQETDNNRMKYRYCPKCGEKLRAVTYENSAASYADNNGLPTGANLKDYMTLFICSKCRLKYTIQDLIRIKKIQKNRNV